MVPSAVGDGTMPVPAGNAIRAAAAGSETAGWLRSIVRPVPVGFVLLVAGAIILLSGFAGLYEYERVQATARDQADRLARQIALAADARLAGGRPELLQDDLTVASVGNPDAVELVVLDGSGHTLARVSRAANLNLHLLPASAVPTAGGGSARVTVRAPEVATLAGFGVGLGALDILVLGLAILIAGRLGRRTYGPVQDFANLAGALTRERFAQEQAPRLGHRSLQSALNRFWEMGRTLTSRERELGSQNMIWQRRYGQARTLIDLMAEFNQVMVLRAVLERLSLGLSRFFAGDAVAIWIWTSPGGDLELAAQVAGTFPERISSADPWVQQVLAAGTARVRYPWVHEALPSMAAQLLDAQGRIIGIVALTSTRRADYSPEEHAFLRTVIAHAAMAIQNAAVYEHTDALSRMDALTGLHNRREFDRLLALEIERAQSSGQPLTLLMIDIDNFKRINDERGHQVGDLALQQLARLIQSVPRRPGEAAFRFGGEEFAILLPDTHKADAVVTAEYLRGLAEGAPMLGDGLRLTVSLGVASFPEDGRDSLRLVAAADRALYQAKNGGKNRVAAA